MTHTHADSHSQPPPASGTQSFPDLSGLKIGNGRYTLLDVLGAGSYGRVHRALDGLSLTSTPHYRAVKCLKQHPIGTRDEEFQNREFDNHYSLSAAGVPGIVELHDVFYDDHDGFVYVILELCDDGDLFDIIARSQAGSAGGGFGGTDSRVNERIRRTFVQILDAVHGCHSAGVFHRDLKPENVLCMKDGSIRLGDFGLCTKERLSMEFGCGSVFYMSPDCLGQANQYCYSTLHNDIWSLGVLLVTMITGRVPWGKALATDVHYNEFCSNPSGYFPHVLGISKSASQILERIFLADQFARISIPEMREEILVLDTFFRETEKQDWVPLDRAKSDSGWFDSSSEEEEEETEEDDYVSMVNSSSECNLLHIRPISDSGSSCNSGSSQSSFGPITPESRAVDVGVDDAVPDLLVLDAPLPLEMHYVIGDTAKRPGALRRRAFLRRIAEEVDTSGLV